MERMVIRLNNRVFTPRVRIESIHLINFKGVSDGILEFNCKKNPFEKDIQSDILGIYGQNGSGKTTVLEALQLAVSLMKGEQLSAEKYAGLISQGSESARMEIVFQFTNPDESTYRVEYAFSIAYKDLPVDAGMISVRNDLVHSGTKVATAALLSLAMPLPLSAIMLAADNKSHKKEQALPKNVRLLVVEDEVVSLAGMFYGVDYRFAPIFDTRSEDVAFLPKAKHVDFFPKNTSSVIKDLDRYKKRAKYSSKSFIFSDEVKQLIAEQFVQGGEKAQTPFNMLILQLYLHASNNIRLLDSIIAGASRDQKLPIYTASSHVEIKLSDSTAMVDDDELEILKVGIKALNIVLEQLIPGLSLEAAEQIDRDVTSETIKKTSAKKITVYSVRGNTRIPLTQESTGILHLISSLGLLSHAFANQSVTVAIDEIDAGVYEYLLGELLLIFEEYGRGQLLFTCHNLRPMEVLDRKFVCFTTTNPNNRYLKLKNIRKEKNLREAYLKEIIAGDQDEELYSSAKHGKIASALQKAGEIIGQET